MCIHTFRGYFRGNTHQESTNLQTNNCHTFRGYFRGNTHRENTSRLPVGRKKEGETRETIHTTNTASGRNGTASCEGAEGGNSGAMDRTGERKQGNVWKWGAGLHKCMAVISLGGLGVSAASPHFFPSGRNSVHDGPPHGYLGWGLNKNEPRIKSETGLLFWKMRCIHNSDVAEIETHEILRFRSSAPNLVIHSHNIFNVRVYSTRHKTLSIWKWYI